MENAYVVDIETNGLLNDLTMIHCIVIRCVGTGIVHRYNSQGNADAMSLKQGLSCIEDAASKGSLIVGHNIIGFDHPAIKKIHPNFSIPEEQVYDTIVASRLIFPDLWDIDASLVIKKNFPKQLSNRHSLEAWGHRLGCHKGEYTGDTRIADVKDRKRRKWEAWNPDMEAYCVQDTAVTEKLLSMLKGKNYSQEAVDMEHAVRWIISQQERYGFPFNVKAAVTLVARLTEERMQIEQQLSVAFPPIVFEYGTFTPKVNNKTRGYTKGAPFTIVKQVEFSASNRNHIVKWLERMYKWKAKVFGNDGKPKMDEVVLSGLNYPEVNLLKKFLVIDKRIAAISTGKEAWLKHERNGRMHGQVNTNGAVTGRATHSKPNLGQVPAVYSDYGADCRALFTASKGRVLVGADQSGVELRCLSHYMGHWDKGAYAKVILEGDVHTANQKAAGLPNRDMAKTFIYAFLYGAGNKKIGSIVQQGAKEGLRLKRQFLERLPALSHLIEGIQAKVAQRDEEDKAPKYLKGLDDRQLLIRSPHAALNTLLQSAGAILAKKSMVIMRDKVRAAGYESRAQQVAWNHDEHQWDCEPEIAEEIGKMQVDSYLEAGRHFKFRIPIDGEYKVGSNWAETH